MRRLLASVVLVVLSLVALARVEAVVITDACPTVVGCEIDPLTLKKAPLNIIYRALATTAPKSLVDATWFSAFSASYGMDINLRRADAEAIRYTLNQVQASSVGGDLIYWESVSVLADQAYDLTSRAVAGNWAALYPPRIMDLITFEGRVLGVPDAYSLWAWWYDKRVFKSLGLVPPTTWAEFLHVLEVIARGTTLTPIGLADVDGWEVLTLYQYIAVRVGGAAWWRRFSAGEINAATDPVHQAVWDRMGELRPYFSPPAFVDESSFLPELVDWGFNQSALILSFGITRTFPLALGHDPNNYDMFQVPPINTLAPGDDAEFSTLAVWIVNKDAKQLTGALAVVDQLLTNKSYVDAFVPSLAGGILSLNSASALEMDPILIRARGFVVDASNVFPPSDAVQPAWTVRIEPVMRSFCAFRLNKSDVLAQFEQARQEVQLNTAVAPATSLPSDTYAGTVRIVLSSATVNATIRFSLQVLSWNAASAASAASDGGAAGTTDASAAGASGFSPYLGPILLPEGAAYRLFAFSSALNMRDSDTNAWIYSISSSSVIRDGNLVASGFVPSVGLIVGLAAIAAVAFLRLFLFDIALRDKERSGTWITISSTAAIVGGWSASLLFASDFRFSELNVAVVTWGFDFGPIGGALAVLLSAVFPSMFFLSSVWWGRTTCCRGSARVAPQNTRGNSAGSSNGSHATRTATTHALGQGTGVDGGGAGAGASDNVSRVGGPPPPPPSPGNALPSPHRMGGDLNSSSRYAMTTATSSGAASTPTAVAGAPGASGASGTTGAANAAPYTGLHIRAQTQIAAPAAAMGGEAQQDREEDEADDEAMAFVTPNNNASSPIDAGKEKCVGLRQLLKVHGAVLLAAAAIALGTETLPLLTLVYAVRIPAQLQFQPALAVVGFLVAWLATAVSLVTYTQRFSDRIKFSLVTFLSVAGQAVSFFVTSLGASWYWTGGDFATTGSAPATNGVVVSGLSTPNTCLVVGLAGAAVTIFATTFIIIPKLKGSIYEIKHVMHTYRTKYAAEARARKAEERARAASDKALLHVRTAQALAATYSGARSSTGVQQCRISYLRDYLTADGRFPLPTAAFDGSGASLGASLGAASGSTSGGATHGAAPEAKMAVAHAALAPPPSMDQWLDDPLLSIMLLIYGAEIHSSESLSFLRNVKFFKEFLPLPDRAALLRGVRAAGDIYDHFVRSESVEEINIDAPMRNAVQRRIAECNTTLARISLDPHTQCSHEDGVGSCKGSPSWLEQIAEAAKALRSVFDRPVGEVWNKLVNPGQVTVMTKDPATAAMIAGFTAAHVRGHGHPTASATSPSAMPRFTVHDGVAVSRTDPISDHSPTHAGSTGGGSTGGGSPHGVHKALSLAAPLSQTSPHAAGRSHLGVPPTAPSQDRDTTVTRLSSSTSGILTLAIPAESTPLEVLSL